MTSPGGNSPGASEGFSTSARLPSGLVIPGNLHRGHCPVHCRRFSNIPDLYSPDATSCPNSPNYDKEKCLRTLPGVLWGTIPPPLVENRVLAVSSALGESEHREASEMFQRWGPSKGTDCRKESLVCGIMRRPGWLVILTTTAATVWEPTVLQVLIFIPKHVHTLLHLADGKAKAKQYS